MAHEHKDYVNFVEVHLDKPINYGLMKGVQNITMVKLPMLEDKPLNTKTMAKEIIVGDMVQVDFKRTGMAFGELVEVVEVHKIPVIGFGDAEADDLRLFYDLSIPFGHDGIKILWPMVPGYAVSKPE